MTPVETGLEFMERINRRDAEKVAELMSDDHLFVDSLGQKVQGRDKMLAGWRGYFAFCSDYWISHEEILISGNTVAIFGAAGGTISAGGKLGGGGQRTVKEWRVYADNKPVYDIMAKSKAAGANG